MVSCQDPQGRQARVLIRWFYTIGFQMILKRGVNHHHFQSLKHSYQVDCRPHVFRVLICQAKGSAAQTSDGRLILHED